MKILQEQFKETGACCTEEMVVNIPRILTDTDREDMEKWPEELEIKKQSLVSTKTVLVGQMDFRGGVLSCMLGHY